MEKLSKAERRAELLRMRDERLGDIKKRFEEAQKRNFNSNFAPGGKDADLVRGNSHKKTSKNKAGNVKNNRPKYMLIDLSEHTMLELTDDEKIDVVAKRILNKYREAFKELAKW